MTRSSGPAVILQYATGDAVVVAEQVVHRAPGVHQGRTPRASMARPPRGITASE